MDDGRSRNRAGWWYPSWRRRLQARLEANSTVVSTAKGPVECSRYGPAGPVVVAIHGTPGGHDQIPSLFPRFPGGDFGLLCWSRPGYLRTPLSAGRAFEEQADLLAALLDALGLHRAALFAFSGGGPVAVHFAARHPQRVWALLLESAASGPRPWPRPRLVHSRLGNWLLALAARAWPEEVFTRLLRADSGLDAEKVRDRVVRALRSPCRAGPLHGLLLSASPPALREVGFANDRARLEQLAPLPLSAVSAPTLIVHGAQDADVPPEHAERAARSIRGAELLRVADGPHLLSLADNAAEVAARRVAFLHRHCHAGMRREELRVDLH
jgi:pimeloyl-ACP methyl ester carboxylesterase